MVSLVSHCSASHLSLPGCNRRLVAPVRVVPRLVWGYKQGQGDIGNGRAPQGRGVVNGHALSNNERVVGAVKEREDNARRNVPHRT